MKLCTAIFFFIVKFIDNCQNANIPHLDGRIVGGKDANITSFPYQVSLRRSAQHACGGSIFHPYYILTAAHCVSNTARTYTIRAGSNYSNRGGTVMKVCSVHVHQNYSADTMINDIAILKLCSPLSFSECILPIALPRSTDKVPVKQMGIVSGWGFQAEEGEVSDVLQMVEVPIITNEKCQSLYMEEIVTNGMLCAGYLGSGGKDACQGDSGGPFRVNGKLFGIVSWGYGCAQPFYPGVYTNVAAYRKWIKSITKY
ncbi:trypsin alpha-like [Diabrotica virgifera virgifera]|uniref:Peptidase S1 domain-containing protein n=1 Tax=Diabrotica virgifera virgifera TaxID=50390 RepID=A0ABM5JZW8_DIAVI|nr:trypsin alpha-like [Diabrotica virgifera virgifera]